MTVIATAARSAIATTSEQAIFYLWDSPEAIRELAGPREIGLRFQPAVAGDLIGIRFWMPSQDTTPTVTVRAWTSGGAPLASKATTGFTAGSWVRVNLDTPVALTAGQVYVVSRNCELVGSICYVPDRDERLSSPITIGDLVALGDGFNGVLTAAGSSGVFPNLPSDDRSNFFVDPIFRRADAPAVAVAVNFPVSVKTAPKLESRVILSMPEKPSVRVGQSPATLRAVERPAANIVRVQFDLVHNSFIVTHANDVGNVRNWSSLANAQGANDGSVSLWDGSLAVAQSGKAHGTMVAQPSRPDSLEIVRVDVTYWGRAIGTIADDLLSGFTVGFRINLSPLPGTDFSFQRFIAGENFLTTPVTFRADLGDGPGGTAGHFKDLTVPAGGTPVTWANIALLQPFVLGQTLVGINFSAELDAARITVTARETWTL